jgi:hypothetical protein
MQRWSTSKRVKERVKLDAGTVRRPVRFYFFLHTATYHKVAQWYGANGGKCLAAHEPDASLTGLEKSGRQSGQNPERRHGYCRDSSPIARRRKMPSDEANVQYKDMMTIC